MTYIASHSPGTVMVLADYFGFLTPTIEARVSSFPPTIIFHNKGDSAVYVTHSETLNRLLPSTIDHQFVTPYLNAGTVKEHAFAPGSHADVDSRAKTKAWFVKHLPPIGD
jgi:hypothetical protein